MGPGTARRKGIGVGYSLVSSSAVLALLVIPRQVIWSYCAGGAVLAIGLAAIFLRGDWQTARGSDKLILFGPLFYAAPIAAFGTEHFTVTGIVSMVPPWIPWHEFWVYLVGAGFIAAGLSLVTGIQARLAASLLGLTFFLFAVLMEAPAWAQRSARSVCHGAHAPANRLKRRASGAGSQPYRAAAPAPRAHPCDDCTILRRDPYPVLQLRAVPARRPRSRHSARSGDSHLDLWTLDLDYLTAVVYAVAGPLLLAGRKTRAAATWLGMIVLVTILAVYVPIGIVERASLDNGLNYLGDTLMFCGDVLLLAGAMPRSRRASIPAHDSAARARVS